MEGNRLFALLDRFSPGQEKMFLQFLSADSPLPVKRRETLLRLYKHLLQLRQRKNKKEVPLLAQALKAAAITPAESRKVATYLLEAAENFLALEEFASQPEVVRAFTAAALNHADVDEVIYGRWNHKAWQQLKGKKQSTQSLFWLHCFEYESCIAQSRTQTTRQGFARLQEAEAALDHYYYTQKLKLACGEVSRARIRKEEIQENESILLAARLEKSKGLPPITQMYVHAIRMETAANGDAHFQSLLSMLRMNSMNLVPEDRTWLLNMGLNYCIRKLNRGMSEQFAPPAFWMYESLIQSSAADGDQVFTHTHYKNYLTLLVRQNQLVRARDFVRRFALPLTGDPKQSLIAFGNGLIHFFSEQYHKAIEELDKARRLSRDEFYGVATRLYLMKAWWYLGEVSEMEKSASALRKLLARKGSILGSHAESYEHFLKFYQQLYLLSTGAPSRFGDRLRELRQNLETSPPFADHGWFRKEVDKLNPQQKK